MNYKVSNHLCGIFGLFGAAGILFIVGFATQMPTLLYSSGGVSLAGMGYSVFLCLKNRRAHTFEAPPAPLRIYRDPSMKRNKSDTDLQLIQVAATNDVGEIATRQNETPL